MQAVISRRRGIQYAAASRFQRCVSGILDRPRATMTTERARLRDLAARCTRVVMSIRPKERAQGRPGARCTRGPCAKEKAHGSHHRFSRKHPAFPAQWFYGFLRALPGDRALLSPSSARSLASHELDASVGASGPHDFAVRIGAVRLRAPSRPPHPAPYVRDDRETPLMWARDGRACRDDLPDDGSGIFFRDGAGQVLGDLPVGLPTIAPSLSLRAKRSNPSNRRIEEWIASSLRSSE